MKQRNSLRSTTLACLAVIASAGAASASPPTAGQSNPWSGLFVGIHGGYGWSDASFNFPDPNFYSTIPNSVLATEPDGYVIGGHISINRQFGALVMGLEFSLSGSDMEETRVGVLDPANFPEDRFTTRVGTHGSLTARLGYASQNFLAYARGGAAGGRVSISATSGLPTPDTFIDGEKTLYGWTVGGGLEYMLSPGVVFGVQYDFMRLDGKDYTMVTTGSTPGETIIANLGDVDVHTVTARLSLKLAP